MRMVTETYRKCHQTIERTVRIGADSVMSLVEAESDDVDADQLYKRWWLSFLKGSKTFSKSIGESVSVVDLYSGAGGLSLGACEALTAVGRTSRPFIAVDVDAEALAVY